MRPTFTTGTAPAKVMHQRHLQEHPEQVADGVGGVFGEGLGAIAALQQEGLALGHVAQRPLELARLTCKNERRKAGELPLDGRERGSVGIDRRLLDGLRPPARRRPVRRDHARRQLPILCHDVTSRRALSTRRRSFACSGGSAYTPAPPAVHNRVEEGRSAFADAWRQECDSRSESDAAPSPCRPQHGFAALSIAIGVLQDDARPFAGLSGPAPTPTGRCPPPSPPSPPCSPPC